MVGIVLHDIAQRERKILVYDLHENDPTIMTDPLHQYLKIYGNNHTIHRFFTTIFILVLVYYYTQLHNTYRSHLVHRYMHHIIITHDRTSQFLVSNDP